MPEADCPAGAVLRYSSRASGIQTIEDLLPIVEYKPGPLPAGGERQPDESVRRLLVV